MVEYFERSDISYKHLLLNNWDPSFETMPYPPATGEYAIYSLTDLFDHMNNVSQKVSLFCHCDVLIIHKQYT